MTIKTRPELVIFDCDGVLVDSEPISLSVILDVLADAGLTISESVGYQHMLGKSLSTNIAWIQQTYGLAVTDAHLSDMRSRLYARFETELKPVQGVADTVRNLGIPVCVASSSQPERIALSLRLTGLLDLFSPNVFSATMVSRGKPAPDLFLFAARKMGVAPDKCVVVEDSPAGIRAAQAGAMDVVGFVGASHAEPAKLRKTVVNLTPSAIISDMTELPALLKTAE